MPMLPNAPPKLVRPALVAVGVAIACTVWLLRIGYVAEFRFDDSFMTLRYAGNLVEHGVLSFNVDDRVDGFTSPGWTLLVAGLLALGAPGEAAMTTASMLAGGASMFAAWWLAAELGAGLGWGLSLGAFGPLSVTGFVVWAASGMETAFAGLMAALTLACCARFEASRGRGALALLSVVVVVCGLSRPENALLAALCWLAAGWVLTRHRANGLLHLDFCWPWLLAALTLLGLFLWHWGYYGHPLPNTYYAKAGGAPLWARGLSELWRFWDGSWAWLGLLGGVVLGVWRRAERDEARLAPLAFVLWAVAVYVQYARAGGDHMGYQRFYQPLVPASAALLAALSARLLGLGLARIASASVRRGSEALLVACVGALLLFASHGPASTAWAQDRETIRSSTATVRRWRAAGETLARHFPASSSMSIRAAGVIPYVTGFRSFDVLGLNNVAVAHGRPATGAVPGHRKEATAADVVAWGPDIIVNHPVIERSDKRGKPPRFFNPPEYRRAGYRYECLPIDAHQWICLWRKPRA